MVRFTPNDHNAWARLVLFGRFEKGGNKEKGKETRCEIVDLNAKVHVSDLSIAYREGIEHTWIPIHPPS